MPLDAQFLPHLLAVCAHCLDCRFNFYRWFSFIQKITVVLKPRGNKKAPEQSECMPINPDPNFVFQASRLEHHLQAHFPGAEVQIIKPTPPAKFALALHVLHNGNILAEIPLKHLGKDEDPLVRTGSKITVDSKHAEVARKIVAALLKAHEEMKG